jgi:hypothetical protein
MCETCPAPQPGRPRITRAAKTQWALMMLAIIGALAVGALGGGSEQAPDEQRSMTAADRVFVDDMARQAARARRLAARAAGSPRLEALARRLEREDRRLAGRGQIPSPAERMLRPADANRAVRDAIRRHVVEDRIIAQLALATGTSAVTKRAAVELLRASRDWTGLLRD